MAFLFEKYIFMDICNVRIQICIMNEFLELILGLILVCSSQIETISRIIFLHLLGKLLNIPHRHKHATLTDSIRTLSLSSFKHCGIQEHSLSLAIGQDAGKS